MGAALVDLALIFARALLRIYNHLIRKPTHTVIVKRLLLFEAFSP